MIIYGGLINLKKKYVPFISSFQSQPSFLEKVINIHKK